jgi:hypothetical protein
LDWAEVAAATMCDTTQCPVCKCPVLYPYQNKDKVQAAVEAARNKHLDAQGRVKPHHQKKGTANPHNIVYDIVYDIVSRYIAYDITYDIASQN